MKKLNITKKQFGESKYFTNKYGTLKYVSENGKFYRTSKGQVLKFLNESEVVKEGAGAGYDITVSEIEIGKIVSVKLGDDKGSWAEFEATIKPCYAWVTAEGYYDVFCQDETIGIDGGTISGEVFDIDYFESEEEALAYAKSELEGSLIDIKTMYGGGWMHQYLPEDGDITFKGDLKNTDYYNISAINIKSQEMSDVVNFGYDNVGSNDDEDEKFDESWLGDKLGSAGKYAGKLAGDIATGAGKLAWKGAKAVGKATGKAVGRAAKATGEYVAKDAKKTWDKWTGNNKGDLKKGEDVVISNDKGEKIVGTVMGYDNVDGIYSIKDETKNDETDDSESDMKQENESRIVRIKFKETICLLESSQYDEGLKDALSAGWNKVKDGAKKIGKKIGDVFNGPFRKGDHIKMSGENGETVKGTITNYDMGDNTYTVLLGNNYDD